MRYIVSLSRQLPMSFISQTHSEQRGLLSWVEICSNKSENISIHKLTRIAKLQSAALTFGKSFNLTKYFDNTSKSQKIRKIVIQDVHGSCKWWNVKSCSRLIYLNFDPHPSLDNIGKPVQRNNFVKSCEWYALGESI